MAQKSHGPRHGTRHKFSRDSREGVKVNDYMKEFEEGEKVLLSFHPSVQEGRVHHRFHGRTAEVAGHRGDAVKIEVDDGGKTKTLFIQPVHLEKVEE